MTLLEKGAALPELGSNGFTISTYNVLLPNSKDGWWIFKYYQQSTKMEDREWAKRKTLLQTNILGNDGGADIVCVQETSADSFDEDFAFMKESGYDHVLHNKFRFRSATFFKQNKFDLKSEKHGDRTLTTLLELKDKDGGAAQPRSVFVVNCHLTGGPSPDKRLRQIHDTTEYIRKEMNKMQPAKVGGKKNANADDAAAVAMQQPPQQPAVILCGDFNEEGDTAVKMLLCEGSVPANFTSQGTILTSKVKKQELGIFCDAHAKVYATAGATRPPSLICPNLAEHFVLDASAPDAAGIRPTQKLVHAVSKAWECFTGGSACMSREAMEKWLVQINGQIGRGSEYRNAVAVLEKKREAGEDEVLTFEEFLGLYVSELAEGKFWGVHHDLQQRLESPVDIAC